MSKKTFKVKPTFTQEQMVNISEAARELDEQILVEKLERLEQNPSLAILWRKVRRSKCE